jgi:hypothetical protein
MSGGGQAGREIKHNAIEYRYKSIYALYEIDLCTDERSIPN